MHIKLFSILNRNVGDKVVTNVPGDIVEVDEVLGKQICDGCGAVEVDAPKKIVKKPAAK